MNTLFGYLKKVVIEAIILFVVFFILSIIFGDQTDWGRIAVWAVVCGIVMVTVEALLAKQNIL